MNTYRVEYYTLSDCRNSVKVRANSGDEAQEIVKTNPQYNCDQIIGTYQLSVDQEDK